MEEFIELLPNSYNLQTKGLTEYLRKSRERQPGKPHMCTVQIYTYIDNLLIDREDKKIIVSLT